MTNLNPIFAVSRADSQHLSIRWNNNGAGCGGWFLSWTPSGDGFDLERGIQALTGCYSRAEVYRYGYLDRVDGWIVISAMEAGGVSINEIRKRVNLNCGDGWFDDHYGDRCDVSAMCKYADELQAKLIIWYQENRPDRTERIQWLQNFRLASRTPFYRDPMSDWGVHELKLACIKTPYSLDPSRLKAKETRPPLGEGIFKSYKTSSSLLTL